MADAAVTVLDSNGVARAVDAQTVGTDYQQTVTLGDGATAGRVAKIDTDGSIQVETNRSATATVTSITASTTSVTILAANVNRRGAIVFNTGTGTLYLRYGTTAATTALYSVRVATNASWLIDVPTWEGAVTGIWSATGGAALVTDMSA